MVDGERLQPDSRRAKFHRRRRRGVLDRGRGHGATEDKAGCERENKEA
jgi:hypothetical protein